jgi:hypothetical protein
VFANEQRVDPDELVSFFGSMGWIGGLPAGEAHGVLDEVRSRLVHREYRLPFETDVHWASTART